MYFLIGTVSQTSDMAHGSFAWEYASLMWTYSAEKVNMNWRFDRSVWVYTIGKNLIDDLNTFSFNWFLDEWVMDN